MLEKEYEYFKEHKKNFLNGYKNKYVVIKDDKTLGFYDTLEIAITESLKENELGTFLVKQVKEEEQSLHFFRKAFI